MVRAYVYIRQVTQLPETLRTDEGFIIYNTQHALTVSQGSNDILIGKLKNCQFGLSHAHIITQISSTSLHINQADSYCG